MRLPFRSLVFGLAMVGAGFAGQSTEMCAQACATWKALPYRLVRCTLPRPMSFIMVLLGCCLSPVWQSPERSLFGFLASADLLCLVLPFGGKWVISLLVV